MSLRQAAHYNDFSPKIRKELEDRVRSYGKSVRYKFNVGRTNPDTTFHDGKIVYPQTYTLDPVSFYVDDKYEDRDGKSKSKLVMLVVGLDEKGVPNKFKKCKAEGRRQCIVYLELDNQDDFDMAMYLELHPKTSNGLNPNKDMQQVVSRVDDLKEAQEATEKRQHRRKALNAIADMTDVELVRFADAMQWDSTVEIPMLKNQAEELAEENPIFFNDLVSSKLLEYQAVVKQSKDRRLITFDPANGKFTYAETQQPLAIVSVTSDKNDVVSLAEWLMAGGVKADEAFLKLKSLLGQPELVG